ncbi:unnamed protein product, partial [Rotaria sp. Silwood2]
MFTSVLVILTTVIIVANAYKLPEVVISNEDSSVKNQKLEQNKGVLEGDIMQAPARNHGVAKIGTSVRWPNGIVPYEFATGYTAEQQAAIVSRIRKLESLTAINNVVCIQFRPRVSSDVYYITIRNGEGCYSYIGQNTGVTMERTVSLKYPGCFDDGRMMHEFIHTLGFYHEQSRPDRDSYVKINWENMQTDMRSNFEKYDNTVVNTLNTAYDYASIMHYEKTAFTNNFLPTIEPLQANVKIGQRYKLSSTDIQEIQQFYNCSAAGTLLTTTPTSTTTNLFSSFDDANNDNWEFNFTINFPSAYTMDFAITTYSSGVTGPFQIVATGSNKATFARISSIANPSTTSTTKLTTTTTKTTTSTTTTTKLTTTTITSTTTTTTKPTTTTTKPSTTTSTTTTKPTTTTTKPSTTTSTTTTKPTTTSTTASTTTTKPTTTSTTTTKPTTTSTTTTKSTTAIFTTTTITAAGGTINGNTVELYNTTTKIWSAGPSMFDARILHTATLLPDGRLIATGGYYNRYLKTAEIYNPTTNTRSTISSMNTARYGHQAIYLPAPSNKLLVMGGVGNNSVMLQSCELYDFASNTWTYTTSMIEKRVYFTATYLPSLSKVLAIGGTAT